MIRILGIKTINRLKSAKQIQDILTKFGCSISTRLGMNNIDEDPNESLIVLELTGDQKEWEKLQQALLNVPDVQLQKMEFDI